MAKTNERGFALIAVLMVLALLGVIGAEFAYSMRLEASAARVYKDSIIAGHLAEAAVEQATREIAGDYAFVVSCDQGEGDGSVVFFSKDLKVIVPMPRTEVPFGAGQFSYRITDEDARLNINRTTPPIFDLMLQRLGVEKQQRDVIVDSWQDWRDTNEEHRTNGAESDDYYLTLPVPYRARNGNLESVKELLQIRGVTPTLFYGVTAPSAPSTTDTAPTDTSSVAGLVDLVSVSGSGRVNLNTAGPIVLDALGLSQAEVEQVRQTRCSGPFANVPGQFGTRGFSANSQTFRVEAAGIVGGKVRARLTAILQKRPGPATGGTGATAANVVTIDWSGLY